eukprot:358080-Chlamydomonas_euryale.AAC.3
MQRRRRVRRHPVARVPASPPRAQSAPQTSVVSGPRRRAAGLAGRVAVLLSAPRGGGALCRVCLGQLSGRAQSSFGSWSVERASRWAREQGDGVFGVARHGNPHAWRGMEIHMRGAAWKCKRGWRKCAPRTPPFVPWSCYSTSANVCDASKRGAAFGACSFPGSQHTACPPAPTATPVAPRTETAARPRSRPLRPAPWRASPGSSRVRCRTPH